MGVLQCKVSALRLGAVRIRKDDGHGRSGISERGPDGRRPPVRRKSYSFATDRLVRNKAVARAFWVLLRLTYGKPLWNICAASLGCTERVVKSWSYGTTAIPRVAAELALVRARKRRAGLREAYEAALAREDAELAGAIADLERLLRAPGLR